MTDLHQLVCNECGDGNVITDAWASMNPETGKMELEEDLLEGFCLASGNYIESRYTHILQDARSKATIRQPYGNHSDKGLA